MGLADERCGACDGRTPRLDPSDVEALRAELDPGWAVRDGHLWREWRFRDFATALAFVVRIGAVAESEGHHPDVHFGWGRVSVELWTHAIGGLSRADLVLAARLDALG